MFEQAFKNIDDALWKESGCTTELDYTEQTSWLLFLKYLDGLEQDKAAEAMLEGKTYNYILDATYRWESWAAPKDAEGKLDHNKSLTGDDLVDFVDRKLFGEHQGAAMKAGWQTKKVSEIATHSLGKMLDKAKNKGELKPYLRNLNVRWFGFDLTDVLEMRFMPEESAKYTAVKGDVLICEGGYPGRAAIWQNDQPIYFQKALHRVRFHEPQRNKWFLYFLLSKDLDGTLKSHFNGAGIQHFTGEALAKFEVPIPPLSEQCRIVAILDEAFDGITTAKANAEKNLQNARALFESYLESVFTERDDGWVEKSLEDVVDAQCTLSYGIVQPGHEYANGMPVVRPTDLTAKVITLDGLKRIDPKLADGYRRTTLRGGELLLCVRGSTGVVSVTSPELAGANVTRGIVPIVFASSRLRQDFGYFLMTSEAVQSQIRAKTYGAALMQINIGDLRKIAVAFPSLEKQEVIAAKLEELSGETQRLESLYQQKLTALDDLKKSLLHQAFSGQI